MVKLFLFYLCSFLAATGETNLKMETLMELSEVDDVIMLNTETFKSYVLDNPKTYTIIVLFSTTHSKGRCPGCLIINPIFTQISKSYKHYNHHSAEDGQKPIFFAFLNYSKETHDHFSKFSLSKLPSIYISTKPLFSTPQGYNYDKNKLWEYSEDITEDGLLKIINRKTDKSVEMQYSLIIKYGPIIGLILGVCLIVLILIGIIKNIKNPVLWWIGAIVVNTICMGGAVYDILNGRHLSGIDDNTGELQIIAPGMRVQHIVEGFLMSFSLNFAGVGIVIINKSANRNNSWIIRLQGLLGLSLLVLLAYKVDDIYKKKVSWYKPGFYPPSHYKTGSLMSDQGNSF